MDYYYILKLQLVGAVSFWTFMAGYMIYNIVKSRKIFLNQSKELKEKYKPFCRNDV